MSLSARAAGTGTIEVALHSTAVSITGNEALDQNSRSAALSHVKGEDTNDRCHRYAQVTM
jgi:hypothetical protein